MPGSRVLARVICDRPYLTAIGIAVGLFVLWGVDVLSLADVGGILAIGLFVAGAALVSLRAEAMYAIPYMAVSIVGLVASSQVHVLRSIDSGVYLFLPEEYAHDKLHITGAVLGVDHFFFDTTVRLTPFIESSLVWSDPDVSDPMGFQSLVHFPVGLRRMDAVLELTPAYDSPIQGLSEDEFVGSISAQRVRRIIWSEDHGDFLDNLEELTDSKNPFRDVDSRWNRSIRADAEEIYDNVPREVIDGESLMEAIESSWSEGFLYVRVGPSFPRDLFGHVRQGSYRSLASGQLRARISIQRIPFVGKDQDWPDLRDYGESTYLADVSGHLIPAAKFQR